MKQEFYKLPLNFKRFFTEKEGRFETCTELESINQHIELLLTTCPGEHRFDPDFGCRIWELDFNRVVSMDQWKELFTQYVTQALHDYEKRLSDITIAVDIRDVIREEIQDSAMIRKRVDIIVKGVLNSSSEQCAFGFKLFLGPLSND